MENLGFKTKLKQNERANFITFQQYFDWLQNMALNVFEWTGLPDTIPNYWIEYALFTRGRALFFKDETKGFLCLPCTGTGNKNVYGEDVSFYVNSYGYSKFIPADEGAIVWNNYSKSPTSEIILTFASRLANVERVTDTNMNAQRTPVLLVGDEKSILTLKNIYKQYAGNEPVIFGDKNFMNNQTIQAIATQAPYVIDKLDVHKQNLWNEALTFLGINNANTDKKERLITSEVNANKQQVQTNMDLMLNNRLRACDDINKKFNIGIGCKIRESMLPPEPTPDPEDPGEDEKAERSSADRSSKKEDI